MERGGVAGPCCSAREHMECFNSVVNTGAGQAKPSSTTTMVAAALRSTAQNQQHQQHHHAEWLPKALMSGEDRAVGSVLDHTLLGRSSVGSSSGCCWEGSATDLASAGRACQHYLAPAQPVKGLWHGRHRSRGFMQSHTELGAEQGWTDGRRRKQALSAAARASRVDRAVLTAAASRRSGFHIRQLRLLDGKPAARGGMTLATGSCQWYHSAAAWLGQPVHAPVCRQKHGPLGVTRSSACHGPLLEEIAGAAGQRRPGGLALITASSSS